MQTNDSLKTVQGRATGVLFFSGFGCLWLWMGLATMHRATVATTAAVVILLAALVVPSVLLLLRKDGDVGASADDAATDKAFQQINVAQWIAIPAAVVLLSLLHQTDYIVPAIATIVGLHLFPLARLFRYRMHYVTGALLVGWSLACAAAMTGAQIQSFGAIGTAAILLGSAAYTLTRARLMVARLETCQA